MTTATTSQAVAQDVDAKVLAPWPLIDKYPVVIGPGLSLTYISSIFRLSLTGYRMQYVDLLDELLEKEPHGYSVLMKRILGVAVGELNLKPAKCAKKKREQKKAQEIAEFCATALEDIPDLRQHLASLLWANYYALSACEIHWKPAGATGWLPARLSFVHSRRLSYPVSGSWDLYIWDQGQVRPFDYGFGSPTNDNLHGLRIGSFPAKFITHAPQIRGGYPTREGLGRQLAYWFAYKSIAAGGAPKYLERFSRPWPEAEYATSSDGKPVMADKEAIDSANAALKAMGAGNLASWVHPDSVKLNMRTPDGSTGGTGKITFGEWIGICNSEISKATLGGTLSTEVGTTGGNRSLGDTQKRGETKVLQYDAALLGDTLKRDLITYIVAFNFPGFEHLVPTLEIQVEDSPDPLMLLQRAKVGVEMLMPVDADKLAAQTNIPLIEPGDEKARRLIVAKPYDGVGGVDLDIARREQEVRTAYPEAAEQAAGGNSSADGAHGEPDGDEADASESEPDKDDKDK